MIITINQQNPIYLDQCFWRDELISGCVGILFDLDEKLLLEKDAQLPQREGPDTEWDWKGLVFASTKNGLNQKVLWEPGSAESMSGLENHERYTRVLSDGITL